MINMDEINAEIAALEAGKTTYATCERLSILYNVRNNLEPDKAPSQPTPKTASKHQNTHHKQRCKTQQ